MFASFRIDKTSTARNMFQTATHFLTTSALRVRFVVQDSRRSAYRHAGANHVGFAAGTGIVVVVVVDVDVAGAGAVVVNI